MRTRPFLRLMMRTDCLNILILSIKQYNGCTSNMDVLIPFDKDTISKVSLAILFFYGTIIFLAPQKAGDIYGRNVELKDPKSVQVIHYLLQRSALCNMSMVVMWYLHFEAGLSRDKAVGICALPWILMCLHSLLNETMQKMGSSPRVEYQALFFFILTAYATLSETTYSNLATKIQTGWGLVNGLAAYMYPAAIGTMYGIPEREDYVLFLRRYYGMHLLVLAVFGGSFVHGRNLFDMLGLFWAVGFALTVGLWKDIDRMKTAKKPIYAWLVLAAFFAVTLLMQ
jgi:hypothetical protein